MARKPRITTRGITQHIYSRCIEKRDMLRDNISSNLLMLVIVQTQQKYEFELIAYQIMDNHFHFIIRTLPGRASISRIMQYIKARFAEKYNQHMHRTGPFWNERFKDMIIETADNPHHYLLWLLWHLAFNPLRKKTGGDPCKYQYSSINCYLDEHYKSPLRITLHRFFINLGSSFQERVQNFRWYEEAHRKRWAILF